MHTNNNVIILNIKLQRAYSQKSQFGKKFIVSFKTEYFKIMNLMPSA